MSWKPAMSTLRKPEADDRPHWRCGGTGLVKHQSGAYWNTCNCRGTGVETKR